ncbi:thiol-disulfide oxidoreductase DCC family protein [Aliamphritea ceti]|uniref:thiol-disulfide oxidoreductase DCC family protein n=1 Tax=Aliamphritea ceti TaxID=1524258 RepID=UPI0021C3EB0C|nr:DUF393 domain-containing protein [Aliamphritea ceti]
MRKPKVFFDGSCPLCRKEIRHYQRLDKAHRLEWLDLHNAEQTLQAYDISQRQAMQLLHVIDNQNISRTGVAAFIVIWDNLPGYRHLATTVRLLHLEPLMQSLYLHFARWRFTRRCNDGCSTEL